MSEIYDSFKISIENYKDTFSLEKAICNHGFFMMAPNIWSPSHKCFKRPLRLADGSSSALVSITHPQQKDYLRVFVYGTRLISSIDKNAIMVQVIRMLRLSPKDENDIKEYHKVHSEAMEIGFGRLFRSPTIFEDLVKSILLMNCSWHRSLEMAKCLCSLQLKLSNGSIYNLDKQLKRKRGDAIDTKIINSDFITHKSLENFPSAKELSNLNEDILNQHCNLGYRASYIIELAKRYERGKFNYLEDNSKKPEEVLRELQRVKGIGPFVGACVMMCIGSYERVPVDSETKRLVQEVHQGFLQERKRTTVISKKKSPKKKSPKKKSPKKTKEPESIMVVVEELYSKYAPFQCLAYWMEMMKNYESKVGKLSELPQSEYQRVTSDSNERCVRNNLVVDNTE